jgi:ubiquinol-cytochrome c reductase iron-sulfur subunit
MAHDDLSGKDITAVSSAGVSHETAAPGTAVIPSETFENPGFPAHRARVTDTDPQAEKKAERQVYTFFYLSIVGSIFAIASYMAFPIEDGDTGALRLHTMMLGIGIVLALFGLGFGAVHWSKSLMANHEGIDQRHPVPGSDETRARAVEIFKEANEESGFGRRTLVRNTLLGALVAFPLPAVVLFRGWGPQDEDPVEALQHTMWKKGARLTLDPSGLPIKASDVTLGSAFHVIPEGLNESEDRLEEKAKAAVLLMRLDPGELRESPERSGWSYDGIVAYSKICTHVGCPVALYEQQTHHLLCPCHQSTFDVTEECKVIFGPAKRALPQLPIAVDGEGYLIAQSDFHEPVGPSFWERSSS